MKRKTFDLLFVVTIYCQFMLDNSKKFKEIGILQNMHFYHLILFTCIFLLDISTCTPKIV